MKETYSRNIGLIDSHDQDRVESSVVGIAGTGADGGLAAERIIRMGIKKIRLSDPETFDVTNINRQFGATFESVGKNKCEEVGKELKRIRPDLDVEVFPDGINKDNANDFVKDCSVVLDEIEYTIPSASVALHQAARLNDIEVLAGLNLGFGINIFRFMPKGVRFEKIIGFGEKSTDAEFRMETLVPNIPNYVSAEVVERALRRESHVPTISPTIGLLSGFLSYLVLGIILDKWHIPEVPKFLHVDMRTMKFSILELE